MKVLLTKNYLTSNFSNSGRQNFLKFSEIVEGSVVHRSKNFFRKIYRLKKYHGKIFKNLVGGPSLPGVAKFQKMLRWTDRRSRGLFKGEKILALRRTQLNVDGIKI